MAKAFPEVGDIWCWCEDESFYYLVIAIDPPKKEKDPYCYSNTFVLINIAQGNVVSDYDWPLDNKNWKWVA